jgi:hypothetical protein
MMRAKDPLNLFFESLDKVAAFGPQVKTALPAHGDIFTDLAGRANDIKEHHVGRLQKLRDACIEVNRPTTVMEMSTYLFSPRSQGGMADSETYAHLEHLRLAGEMDRVDVDGRYQYTLKD